MKAIDAEAIEQSIEARLAKAEQLRWETLGRRPLRWLALLPEWTRPLALACEFPVGAEGLDAMLQRAQAAGLCEVRRESSIADLEEVRFWMPAETRATLFDEWRAAGVKADDEAREIVAKVLAAPESVLNESATGVLRWAVLAAAELSPKVATGEELKWRVMAALGDGNTGAAGEWIRAGELLGLLLGGEMELAAARARRQLSRHYRATQDARYLEEFVRREEQIEEIERLLGPSEEWAVHFIGQSGVGKTMLMRYLCNRPPDKGPDSPPQPGCAARIDFDYIDPRFPLERPTRLLTELAEDLAANVTTASQEALRLAFGEAVTRFEADRMETIQPNPLTTLGSPRFKDVVGAFADFLKSLPPPVLLVLDTCEELARLHPPGEDVPSIEAMFEIVEQIHAAAPDVRVAFAGRRWLTRKAANELRGLATPPAVMSAKPRPYMRMHAVRGFTRKEAVSFLRESRGLEIDDAMIEAVLENTLDRGKPASMEDAEGPDEKPRYSPIDVGLYASWIEWDSTLKPSDLAGGNQDVYVDVRIFRRIESPEVRAAIPAAMLLERFDGATIAPALGGDAMARRQALDGLIEQEWTHLEGGPDPEQIVLSIDRGLLSRLQSYFARTPERRRELERARSALVPHLERLFMTPTTEVAPDRIDSALKVLGPARAARLFDVLAERIADEGAWLWGESLCSLLLSPEREPQLPDSLVASVCALYVGVLNHRGAGGNLGALRENVVREAGKHPSPQARRVLDARGKLSLLAAAAADGDFEKLNANAALTRGRLLLGRSETAMAIAPGLLAAVEALIDAREERPCAIPAENISVCLAALAATFADDETVRAHLLALEGRMRSMLGERKAARAAFGRVRRMSLAGRPRSEFVDWVPPESLRHRIVLEILRFRLSTGSETSGFLTRCEASALKQGGVDAAQLFSLALQARLARGELTEREVQSAERYEVSIGSYARTAPPHRSAPPLFVSIAECWLGVGRPRHALDLLLAREQSAASRRTDEDTTRDAALATVRILRRQRLRERFGLISSLSLSPDPEVRAETMAAGALIAGLRPPRGTASTRDHAAWRARILLDPRTEEPALAAMRAKAGGGASLHLALDRLEAESVQLRWTRRGRRRVGRAGRMARSFAVSHDDASMREPLDEERLRLLLRRSALLEDRPSSLGAPAENRALLLGRLALEEGELMALRLPDRAIALLDLAERLMDESGDEAGAFIAALRKAIAEIHAGRSNAARADASGVFARYRALRRVKPELPPLESLPTTPLEQADHGGDPWREWTHRLEVYRRWCDAPSTRTGVATLDPEPETDLAPAIGAGGLEVRASVRRRGIASALTAIAGLTVLGTGLLVGISNESALHGLLGGLAVLGAGIVSGFVGALCALLYLTLVRRVFRTGSPVAGFELSLVLSPGRSERALDVEAHLDPWARGRLARIFLRVLRMLPPRARWTAKVQLDEETIDRPLPDALAIAVARQPGRQFVPVRLAATASLSGLAWERWLLAGVARRDDLSPEDLPPVWRVRSRGLLTFPPDLWLPQMSILSSPRWKPYIESSAAKGVSWGGQTDVNFGRATIALGFPALTRAGWRLRLDEEASLGRLDDPSGSSAQELVSPDRVAHVAPIAIVIGRPGGDLSPERWTADGLRAFANETFLAGARAVITVPSLSSERTSEAILLLTEEISAWHSPPDSERLCGLAARLRGAVYESGGGLDEEERRARYDQALDVCLFAPR